MAYHICGACWGWNCAKWTEGLSLPSQAIVRSFSLGGLGVPMFFVLSGFLIHYTFSRSADQSTRTFWLRRFGRIYPPYLIALLVFAAVKGFLWTRHGLNDLLNHAIFVHTFKNNQFFSINPSFWSLAHEFQFYLLYPLLVRVRRLIGMEALVCGFLALRLTLDVLTLQDRFGGSLVFNMMLPKLYFEWILGMYVADRFIQNQRAFALPPIVGWMCVGIAFICAGQGWFELLKVPALALATAIWIDRIVHLKHEPGRLDRVLAPLGVISYSLYLWHQPIVNELCQRVVKSPPGLELWGLPILTAIAATVCAVTCILVAKGAYELIEAPCMKLTKMLTTKPLQVVAVAEPLRQAA
jgi:peptidoglycan/LPS O-acetylase OafA/YrhL